VPAITLGRRPPDFVSRNLLKRAQRHERAVRFLERAQRHERAVRFLERAQRHEQAVRFDNSKELLLGVTLTRARL
jgi:hypothetical protein